MFSIFPGFPSHIWPPVLLFWGSSLLLSLGTWDMASCMAGGTVLNLILLHAGNAAHLSDAEQKQAMPLDSRQNLMCWESSGWGPHLNPSTDSLVTPGETFNVSGHPSQTNVTTTMMSQQVLSWKPSHGTLCYHFQLYTKALQSTRVLARLFWTVGFGEAGPQVLVKQDMAMTASKCKVFPFHMQTEVAVFVLLQIIQGI